MDSRTTRDYPRRITHYDALPYPRFFAWGIWLMACLMAYLEYYGRGHVSLSLSLTFWGLAAVVTPLTAVRRERDAVLIPVAVLLVMYTLMIHHAS
jgi:hypothetical protein